MLPVALCATTTPQLDVPCVAAGFIHASAVTEAVFHAALSDVTIFEDVPLNDAAN